MTSATATDSRMETITALLRKAEGTDNEHERDTYMAKAYQLATKYSIDMQDALQNATAGQRRAELTFKTVKLGEPNSKGLMTFVRLYYAIAKNNGVELIALKSEGSVRLYGYDTDIELISVLYASLSLQMVSASNAYIRSGAFKSDYVYTSAGYKKVHATSARISFQNAYVNRINARLKEAKAAATTASAPTASGNSAALVLVNRDKAVANFYAMSTAGLNLRKTRGSSSVHSRAAANAGRSAADRASLGTGSNTVGRSTRGQLS